MSSPSSSTSSLPPRPRLVLRLGFAGRKELSDPEHRIVADSLHQVMQTLAKRLSSIAPGTPVEAGKEPPVSAFFSKQCPLLRLVTGLCEGADAVAAEALTKVSVSPDAGTSSPLGTPCIETELAAVLPFDVETYRSVDTHYLTEPIRGMDYLPEEGSNQPPVAAPPQFAARVVRQSAVDWLINAIVRSVSHASLSDLRQGNFLFENSRYHAAILPLQSVSLLTASRDSLFRQQSIFLLKPVPNVCYF